MKKLKQVWNVQVKVTDTVYEDEGPLYNKKQIIKELTWISGGSFKVKVVKIKKGE